MSYSLILLSLLLGVYLVPGLAVFPRLLVDPHLTILLPVFSAGVTIVLTTVLSGLGLFTTEVVHGLGVLLAGIALYRCSTLAGYGSPFKRLSPYARALGCTLILFFPYCVKIGMQAFDTDDEIYSWNVWALQHSLGHVLSFENTGAPYPQGFPKILAYHYQWLGNIEWQLPLRAGLIFFPWTVFALLAVSARQLSIFLALVVVCAFWANWQQYFDYGYADFPMVAFLSASVFCWLGQEKKWPGAFPLSVFFALCAALTKQPGLIWAALTLPLLILFQLKRSPLEKGVWLSLIAGVLFGWFFLEGQGFTHNVGVVEASQQGRTWGSQLWYAIKTYWIAQPAIALLYLGALGVSLKTKKFGMIWFFFIVPATLLWFLFGAYHLRLGLHILAVLALIIALELEIPFKGLLIRRGVEIRLWIGALLLSLGLSWGLYQRSVPGQEPSVSVYKASTISFRKYFGSESDWVLANLYDHPELRLFIPTNYIMGLFYGHTPIVRPSVQSGFPYDEAALLRDFKTLKPDYVFTSGELLQGEPASGLIGALALKRPDLLEPVVKGPNRLGYRAYRLHLNKYNSAEPVATGSP